MIYNYTDVEMNEAIKLQMARDHLRGRGFNGFDMPRHRIISLIYEVAFEKLSGHPMDRRIRKKGDDNIDFMVDGHSVDIKGTSASNGNLVVDVGQKAFAEYFILGIAYEHINQVDFVGWAWREEVLSSPITKNMKHNNYFRARGLLYPMDQLVTFLPSVWSGKLKQNVANE